VSGVLGRVAGVFVAPAAAQARGTLTRAAVLGAAGEARGVAAATALALGGGVVAAWCAGPVAGAPATVGARRLAARLVRRGVEAVARGRLVWVALPDAAADAAALARRLDGALADAPLVLALGGARVAPLEPLLAEMEVVVVAAEPGSALVDVALARLENGVAVPPPAGFARWLALAGWAGAAPAVREVRT